MRPFDLKRNLWELVDYNLQHGPERCPKTGSAINKTNVKYLVRLGVGAAIVLKSMIMLGQWARDAGPKDPAGHSVTWRTPMMVSVKTPNRHLI